MDKQEPDNASLDLVEVEKKFASSLYDLCYLVQEMTDHLSGFKDYFKSWRELFGATRDLMEEHLAVHRESVEAYKVLAKAIIDSNASATENNERMEKLITKVESYFGDGTGLDHEN